MKYWFEVKEQDAAINNLIDFVEEYPYAKVRIFVVRYSPQRMVISVTTSQSLKDFIGLEKLTRKPREAVLSKFQLNYYKNMQLWFDFYLMYNDNNERHALNSFDNHNFQSVSQLVHSNITWVKEIMERGYSKEDILQNIPGASEIINKV